MKNLIFLAIFLPALALGQAYYVSNSGLDSNDGLGITTPFQTVQRAASIMNANDACFIRGGVYRETVSPANSGAAGSPITFMPYAGESVTISGADIPALSWSVYSGNIYRAATSLNFIQLFVDSHMMNEARWPNAPVDGLVKMPRATAQTGTDSNTLLDTNLPPGNWAGAYIHITPGYEWSSCTRQIATYSAGSNLTYGSAIPGNGDTNSIPQSGNPYWLFGSLDGLDAQGEWFLDTTAHFIYLWAPGNADPSTRLVEVKTRPLAFDLSGRSYITVYGLNIFSSAVSMADSTYCTMDSCNVKYVDHFRFPNLYDDRGGKNNIMSGSYNEWKNSVIQYSAGNGIFVQGMYNKVTNCLIHDMAYMADYAGCILSDGGDAGTPSYGHIFSGNSLYDSGRFTLFYPNTQYTLITMNDCYNTGLLTKDIGAIYCFGPSVSHNEISYNWAHDVTTTYGSGVYFDNGTNNGVIHHNVIWNCAGNGITLNTPSQNNLVYNNTVLASGHSFGYWGSLSFGFGDPEDMTGTQVKNNLADMSTAAFASKYPPVVLNNGFYPVDINRVPSAGSGAIDAGVNIPGYTDTYSGTGPDIGAYEYGGAFWVPGYKTPAPANTPGGPSPTFTPTPTITRTPTITPTYIPGSMIDDFEDGNNINAYGGTWYTYGDAGNSGASVIYPSGAAAPVAGGPGPSAFALHLTGTVVHLSGGYGSPAAYVSTDLGAAGAEKDFTSCLGFRFAVSGDNRYYKIELLPDSGINTGYNNYKYTFYASNVWQTLQVPFSAFTQAVGWGTVVPMGTVLQKIKTIRWSTASYPISGSQYDFSFSLDNLEVYGCGLATPTFTAIPTPIVPMNIIDTCDHINGANMWGGSWYSYDDSANSGASTVWPISGNFQMSAPGFDSTGYAARLTGTVRQFSYAYPFIGMGTGFGGVKDFSTCAGVRFWYKNDGKQYYVKVQCESSINVGYNYYRYSIPPSAVWTQLSIPISSFTQASGWGTTVDRGLYFQKVTDMQFQTDSFPGAGLSWSTDLWIDNPEVYGCYNVPTITPTLTQTLTSTNTPAVPTATRTKTITPTLTYTVTFSATPSKTATATVTSTAEKTASTDLKNAHAYPSPFKLSGGDTGITFTGLTAACLIQVFNLNGELVFSFHGSAPHGEYFWNLSGTRRSKAISSGMYIYAVTNEKGDKARGKLAIIK